VLIKIKVVIYVRLAVGYTAENVIIAGMEVISENVKGARGVVLIDKL
jgi:hypothetical protein